MLVECGQKLRSQSTPNTHIAVTKPVVGLCNIAEGLVERHRRAEERVDDVRVAVELLVHHEREDAHLRGAPVVELDRALELLRLGRELVPAKVNVAVAEVTRELRLARHVLHHAQLEEADEGEDLGKASWWHHRERREARRHLVEREADREVTREAHARRRHDVAKDGEHADAAVLDLDEAEAVEALLVGAVEQVERVDEAERRLRA
eukprot:CAMPEP_0119434010 /NCGR_PEP_ID=MMETSP1335-20130426/50449_1 /TAXON_ID=259385 /ORGANISM="Chrysoculter rhomboideus, Strain RCC1486" /LENGTH=206 /DNA_ID=CAMNT_0007459861 /DNA_START=518 /DNA_END=1134 /DNA_ORIENTATION=-